MQKNILKILLPTICAIILAAGAFNFYGAEEKIIPKKLEVPVLTQDEKADIDLMLQKIEKQKTENLETTETPYEYLEEEYQEGELSEEQFYTYLQYLLATGQAGDINKADKCCPPIFHALSTPRLLGLLLQGGVSVNTKDKDGVSPLLRALQEDNAQAVQLLIQYGAHVQEPTQAGASLLCEAVVENKSEIAKILIQAGATCDEEEHQKWLSALGYKHKGAFKKAEDLALLGTQLTPEIEKDLKGIEQEVQADGSGDTILIRAIKKNNLPLINYLIHNQPALLTTFNKEGHLPLQTAFRSRNRNAAQLIVNQADKKALNEQENTDQGDTPLSLAAYTGTPDLIEALVLKGTNIEGTDKYNFTPLMLATTPEMTEKLLGLGAKISSTEKSSPLDYSLSAPKKLAVLLNHATQQQLNELQEEQSTTAGASYRPTPLINAIQNTYIEPEVIDTLMKAGARLDAPDSAGQFPLHKAVNHPEKLKKLLVHATPQEINQLSRENQTPLMQAIAGWVPAMKDSTRMLLNAGADLTVKDRNGMSPIHNLLDNLRWDLPKEADNEQEVNTKKERKNTRLEILQILLNSKQMSPAVLAEQDPIEHLAPLCYAAKYQSREAALLLINAGAQCNSQTPAIKDFLEPLIKKVDAEKAKKPEIKKLLGERVAGDTGNLILDYLGIPEEDDEEDKKRQAAENPKK